MEKREKIGIGITIGACFFFLGIFILTANLAPKEIPPPPEAIDSAQPQGVKIQQQKITLEIEEEKYESEIEGETNVYDFMSKLQDEGKINFKEKTYTGMGKFIDELNGVRGDGNKFWIYYVNGKKARIGVSNYKIKSGDVVSWKYEKDID